MIVRTATRDDRNALVRLRVRGGDAVTEHWVTDLLLTCCLREPDLTMLVAEEADRIIGTVVVHPAGIYPKLEFVESRYVYDLVIEPHEFLPIAQLDEFFVAADRRSHGVGATLLKEARHAAADLGYALLEVTSQNPHAIAACRTAGMTVTSPTEAHYSLDQEIDSCGSF